MILKISHYSICVIKLDILNFKCLNNCNISLMLILHMCIRTLGELEGRAGGEMERRLQGRRMELVELAVVWETGAVSDQSHCIGSGDRR